MTRLEVQDFGHPCPKEYTVASLAPSLLESERAKRGTQFVKRERSISRSAHEAGETLLMPSRAGRLLVHRHRAVITAMRTSTAGSRVARSDREASLRRSTRLPC